MVAKEIRNLLQKYFNAETSLEEEMALKDYFISGKADPEFLSFTPFFSGIGELTDNRAESEIEDDVMNFILEQESEGKTRYRNLWKAVTGIAASFILVVSGYFIYESRTGSYSDTFNNPEQARAYATQTLQYVSSKYNKGFAQLAPFEKIEAATRPLKIGLQPLNNFIQGIENMNNESLTIKNN